MSTIKVKGNWNQQKGKLKMQFSNIEEDDDLHYVEEEILRSLDNSKKQKKKPVVRKENEW
ncbi:MAG: general stress protein CsbD [Bacteroidetes bacterium]|nr:general stress protein CsbD [Bacteroidota bacterium]